MRKEIFSLATVGSHRYTILLLKECMVVHISTICYICTCICTLNPKIFLQAEYFVQNICNHTISCFQLLIKVWLNHRHLYTFKYTDSFSFVVLCMYMYVHVMLSISWCGLSVDNHHVQYVHRANHTLVVIKIDGKIWTLLIDGWLSTFFA